MNKISTTIDQSLRLIELGLKKTTSDLYYHKGRRDELEVIVKHENLDDEDIPAWSLSALLEVMPKNTNETYHLFSSMMADQLGSWVCDRSKYYMSADGHNKNDYECFKGEDPLTAAYQMVCWLLEQGLIRKEDKK